MARAPKPFLPSPSASASVQESFTWKDKKIGDLSILSPVRTNYNNTCVYRSLCDCLDARARIATGGSSAPFAGKLLEMEEREGKWIKKDGKVIRVKCITHFLQNGDPLPIRPKDFKPQFKVKSYVKIAMKGNKDNIDYLKEILKKDGPFIGSFRMVKDYPKKEGIYYGVGDDFVANPSNRPPESEEPYHTTSSEDFSSQSQLTPTVPNASQPTTEGTEEQKEPEFKYHAVCVVGYKTEGGVDCFQVQENQGSNAFQHGFRLVAESAFTAASVVTVEAIEPNLVMDASK